MSNSNLLIDLAREWINILSVTPLPDDQVAVAIEYTVPPDPNFRQSQYKTATRWVKYVAVLPASSVLQAPGALEATVLSIVKDVREALDHGSRG